VNVATARPDDLLEIAIAATDEFAVNEQYAGKA